MQIQVSARNGEHSFSCDAGERMLYAGLRSGMPLPYECATGTCGTCRARLVSGEVDDLWPEAPGRKFTKAEKREFLMCQALARSDCEVALPGRLKEFEITPAPNGGQLTNINALTHDVSTFEVRLQTPVSFDAGQFVAIKAPGLEGFRAYSMTNYERDTATLHFVVKKMPDGGFSQWLFGGAAEGSAVEVFGPLGRATFHPEEDEHLLCVAGGSGIAGMMSILSRARQEGYFENHQAHVFFGVRTGQDLFFADELASLAALSPDTVHVTVALSDEAPLKDSAQSGLHYAEGLIHAVAGEAMAGKCDNTIAYIAGPPPMVDSALRTMIVKGRIPPKKIRYDKFS